MTITTIKYEKLMPTGAYMNEKIGFECSIEERENPMEVITKLRELAEQAHKEKYPHLYQEEEEVPVISSYQVDELPTTKIEPRQSAIESTKQAILNSKDMAELFSYKKLVNSTPELKEAYETKLEQLK